MALILGAVHTGDINLDTALGNYPGVVDAITTSSYQTANTATVEADVWAGTGNMTWFQAATLLEVISSSANDAAAGTGTRTIFLSGLDTNWLPISETVILNGTNAVPTTLSYLRLNRAVCMTSGTWGGANIGVITIRGVTAGPVQGVIPIQLGRLAKSHFSIPAGKKFVIRSINLGCDTTGVVTFRLYIRDGSAVAAPFGTKQLGLIYYGVQWAYTDALTNLPALLPKIDCWITATPTASNVGLFCDVQGVQISS